MRLSRFVITYPHVRPGEHVLYDVINDHYVGIDSRVLAAVKRWESGPPQGEEELLCHEQLSEQEFLVGDDAQDDARLRQFLETSSEGVPGTMFVTLMPTLACNLACTYCFQKEHPTFTKMKSPTEAATVEWVLRKVDEAASRTLLVHYFGGEPLTRKDYVLRTAEIFSASMAARGARFEWEITTNGLGLDLEFVQAMRAFGPGSIKVTLDGDKETHDAARVYRDGRGSFEEIFTNTVLVAKNCPDVKLRIGGNFQPGQRASYEKLLDRLEAHELHGLIDQIRFKPVVDTSSKECGSCTNCATQVDEAESYVQLATSVESRNLAKSPIASVPSGPCELHWKHSYIIDPEGNVYKCPAVAGRPEMAVTSVSKYEKEKIAPLLELRPWEQCGPCPYLPVCVGGCLASRYLQTGKTDQVSCQKEQFARSFHADVTKRYLAEFTDLSTVTSDGNHPAA